MMRWLTGLFVAALLWTSAVPAQNPDPLRAQRQKEQHSFEQQAAGYPALADMALNDALSIHVEHNNLQVLTRLGPTNGPSRVKIQGLDGINVIDVRGAIAPRPPVALYSPPFLKFDHWDFARPGATVSCITVMISPMNTQISHDMESPAGTEQVSLVQTLGAQELVGAEAGVRLRITVPAMNDKPAFAVDRTAADFVSLRRRYPGEVARYVEPIFRELHTDAAVFSPDPKLSWQVFAADAPIDPTTMVQVKKIVAQLDADEFHDRETAAAELQKLGQPAALCLMRMDRAGLSAEQNSRIQVFLSAYQTISDEEARRLRNDVDFLVDCLYGQDEFVVRSALQRLQELTGRDIPFDTTLKGDARRDAILHLRETLSASSASVPHR